MRGAGRSLLAAAFGATLALPALGTTLDLHGGGRLEVTPLRSLADDGISSSTAGDVGVRGYRYELTEATGRVFSGVIATEAAGPVLDSHALAQNPVTGEIHLVHSSPRGAQLDLAVRTWLGQQWGEPAWLTADLPGDDLDPFVTFAEDGEAVVGWRNVLGPRSSIMVEHALVDADGTREVHFFADLGDVRPFLGAAGGDVGSRSGVQHVAVDSQRGQAFLVLSDADTDSIGVLRLDLTILKDILGGSWVPVPVNLIGDMPTSTSSSGPFLQGERDGLASAGEYFQPYRIELSSAIGYYWFEDAVIRGVGFRGDAHTRLVTLDRPETDLLGHAAMAVALRRELLREFSLTLPALHRDMRVRRSTRQTR